VVAEEGVAAAIPAQRRIRKPRHRSRILVALRIQAAALRILLARILAAVLRILLARSPVVARILAAVLRILLVRIRVVVRILAAVLLILLVRIRVVARPAAARILLLQVSGPVMVRVMRLRRSARRMRHKIISQPNAPVLPQPTVSTRTLRTAISMPTSGAGTQQII
jgi:hypothetical protein